MELKSLKVEKEISPYVKTIFIYESQDTEKNTILPFYADGYPGIIFQQSTNGVVLRPRNKLLSEFFLYGQTITEVAWNNFHLIRTWAAVASFILTILSLTKCK